MKKIIFLSVLIVYISKTHAQINAIPQQYNIVNGDIYSPISSHGSCPTWNDPDLTNWHVTHGTPNYQAIAGGGNNGTIFMIGKFDIPWNVELGEGALTNYTFLIGEKYYIDMGLITNFGPCSTNKVEVTLGNSIPITVNGTSNGCQDLIPTTSSPVFASNSIQGAQVWSLPEFNPTSNVNQLWIKPRSGCSGTGGTAEVTVDHVAVYKCLAGCIFYTSNEITKEGILISGNGYIVSLYWHTLSHTNTIPSGLTNKARIAAGSLTSSVIQNVPNQNTKLLGKKIDLVNNLDITVTSGNWFVIEAVWNCKPGEDCEPPIQPIKSSSGIKNEYQHNSIDELKKIVSTYNSTGVENLNTESTKQLLQKTLSVHPNPTTGSFTIQLPVTEDCEVRITNIMGATVYQSSMKGEQKKQIQLDGGLPAGNYTLQLRGKTINHIEKLVLTK